MQTVNFLQQVIFLISLFVIYLLSDAVAFLRVTINLLQQLDIEKYVLFALHAAAGYN